MRSADVQKSGLTVMLLNNQGNDQETAVSNQHWYPADSEQQYDTVCDKLS